MQNGKLLLDLGPELKDRLKTRADELSEANEIPLSMAWIVRKAVQEWLDRNENGNVVVIEPA